VLAEVGREPFSKEIGALSKFGFVVVNIVEPPKRILGSELTYKATAVDRSNLSKEAIDEPEGDRRRWIAVSVGVDGRIIPLCSVKFRAEEVYLEQVTFYGWHALNGYERV